MRIEGWERRLLEVVDQARAAPYELGVHDCFRLALRVVEALTGVDRWPGFAGRYATRRQALALISAYGSSFEAAFDSFFGVAHVGWRLARRGDIVELQDERGEKHLGVCLGREVVGLAEGGLSYHPLSAARCAWPVG